MIVASSEMNFDFLGATGLLVGGDLRVLEKVAAGVDAFVPNNSLCSCDAG